MSADATHFRLAVPARTACEFALGLCDWRYDDPPDELRCVVGQLLVDQLEYAENWRAAGVLRQLLHAKYPGCFRAA